MPIFQRTQRRLKFMTYKIRRNLNRGPRNEFYINVGWFHLGRPKLRIKRKGTINGFPIIHVDTGRCQ